MRPSGKTTGPRMDMEDSMRRYHEYLAENYEGGCERFFSPTGFLDGFQRTVEIEAHKARSHVFARTIDEAVSKLAPAVAGQDGVFDLTAEPGTGKTSVLPFRFGDKRVIVALPTPFDAWSAFNMATGVCRLKLKGLTLGPKGATVIYTDSYMAAYALLDNYLDYDILIVDECDSDRGVTKCLAEVKTKGKLLIRMSATHGRKSAGTSRAFRVVECDDMPDVRTHKRDLIEYVKAKHANRSLVLAPDAATAKDISEGIDGSVLVTVETRLDLLAATISNQEGPNLYISDDNCGRALNLNLDAVFDCQLVTEYGEMRHLAPEELYQRKNRVGRNREGWYYSPALPTRDKGTNDFDVVRHNVVRAVANVEQDGESRLHVSPQDAAALMCSAKEPYGEILRKTVEVAEAMSPTISDSSSRSYGTPGRSESQSSGERRSKTRVAKVPTWVAYFSGVTGPASDLGKKEIADTFVVSDSRGRKSLERRGSGSTRGSSSGASSSGGASSIIKSSFTGRSVVGRRSGSTQLATASGAPYAVDRRIAQADNPKLDLPLSPPVMDLTQLTYDLDWPKLIRDRLARGGDLPKIIPYGSWRHTSATGMGTDWFRRLEAMAAGDNTFEEDEFEVVVRAWNMLVAQAWVKRTPGLSNVKDAFRIEYCVRYFQSYFNMDSVG